ncbi:MAG: hypothetical protein NZ561_04320, partial [Phycisphaerae bacterium]|nr:hypothetical protein [Phycisphaerae bacterium]MDW8260970.1 hypothetical protein [Phycisphaerales bacterium]
MNLRPKTVRRLLYVAVVFAAVIAVGFGVRAYQDRQRHKRILADRAAGLAAFQRGDYPSALALLRGSVRTDSGDFPGLLALATARARVELPGGRHIPEAIRLFEVLRSARPGSGGAPADAATAPAVVNPLLDLYTRAGYSTEALKLSDAVLAVRPNDPAALRARSIALFSLARFDEALTASLQLNDAAPFDLNGHLQTFWLLRRAKTPPEEIVRRFESWVAKYPNDPRFEMLLGQACGEAGDRRRALELLRTAAERPAPDAEFVAQLVRVFDQQRLFEDSRAVLARAAERSDDPAILRLLVLRLWQDGDHAAVIT